MTPGNSSTTANIDPDYEQLRALERFKSGFLARTSHELRSPINTIVSLSQLILEDLCEGPEEEREFIAQSKTAALKMLALFDQIAAVSKLDIGREPATLNQVDLSFLLPEIEMLTTLQAANQNVRYAVSAPTEEIEIYTDSKWLKNTLVSLIQDTLFHTKSLSVFLECDQTEVAIVIECDHSAAQLQTEIDNLSQFTLDPDASSTTPDISKDIQLSTALILATATITLPLINGKFEITPHSASSDRTHLKCIFSKFTG
ncbi:MAG: HAMP domain-containing sensor histidine kinase [Cyanobacteria bacterium P01_D01_bin.1]